MNTLPTIIVPARLASIRYPEKLLAEVDGVPLILLTARRLREIAPEFEIFFAVDGEILSKVLKEDGFEAITTDPNLASGTDRIATANKKLGRDFVINVQADEPMVERFHLQSLIEGIDNAQKSMSTLATPFANEEDFYDPNQVKVVVDQEGRALYFSRAPIPHSREHAKGEFSLIDPIPLKHLGMYAYEKNFLQSFVNSPPGKLEKTEKLEQLRTLEMGLPIAVSIVERGTVGIDVPSDLLKLSELKEPKE